MDPSDRDRWRRIEELADAALDLPPDAREAWLRSACGDDPGLYREVSTLLEAGERTDAFLGTPLADLAAALPDPAGEDHVPGPDRERVGPYRIVREVGRGGMGTVYLAEREEHFTQRVALKVVRQGLHLDDAFVRRFLEERQLLASMEHANIARVLDGGLTDDGVPWFAMEFVEGEPIHRWCDARRLAVEARLELFVTVSAAVHHAHERRIVHRDLKPSNVLVRDDGVPKLLDFGIAKLLEGPDDGPTTTERTGGRLLTPEYASPEQVAGAAVTPASDVYSLGVLLHELLTGRRPSLSDTLPSIVAARAEHEHDSGHGLPSTTPTGAARARGTTPERLRARLAGELDNIILKALAREPGQRYQTAGDLGEDVRRHLEGVPVRAGGRRRWLRRRTLLVAAGLLLAIALAWPGWVAHGPGRGDSEVAPPLLAVGMVTDYRPGGGGESAQSVADLLATNLARVTGLRMVSTTRLYELLATLGGDGPRSAGDYSAAARRAGAGMMVDGALHALGDSIRLDLRRIDLTSGEVLDAHSVSARDLFSLVDSGTARLTAGLGADPPSGSVADVTTPSETAYRFYDEGLRAFYRGNLTGARSLLQAAVGEDSTFAMASYYLARSQPNTDAAARAMDRALRMAPRASERERLIIETAWALWTSDPVATERAERLIARYPDELDGHLFAARALMEGGDYHAALRRLRYIIAVDSAALAGASARCTACDARSDLIDVHISLDSVEVAVREGRVWTTIEPDRATAWYWFAYVLALSGRAAAAADAYGRAAAIDPALNGQPGAFAFIYLAVGDVDRVDRELAGIARVGAPDRLPDVHWYATISLRQQGRLAEALQSARTFRRLAAGARREIPAAGFALHEAQVLFELGRYREAAALFDTISRAPVGRTPSQQARHRVWSLSLGANVLAAMGDTTRILARFDTVRQLGAQSLLGRDRLLHNHLLGLVLAARGDDDGAVREFERARLTPAGYTRINFDMAKALLRLGRPREAVTVMQQAVRAPLEGSQLYVTSTERRALLAEAWDSSGVRDSAVVHYRAVLDAWHRADPVLAPRVAVIRSRLDRLGSGPGSPGK